MREDAGYFLGANHINYIQRRSIDMFLEATRGMSRADIVLHKNGRDVHFEADWLRHMKTIDGTTAEARAGHALEKYDALTRCLDHYGAPKESKFGVPLSLWGRVCLFAGKADGSAAQGAGNTESAAPESTQKGSAA